MNVQRGTTKTTHNPPEREMEEKRDVCTMRQIWWGEGNDKCREQRRDGRDGKMPSREDTKNVPPMTRTSWWVVAGVLTLVVVNV